MNCEIGVTLAISLLGIAETGVTNCLAVYDFFLPEWKRTQRLREKLEALDPYSCLAGARAKQRTGDTDDVAKIEMREDGPLIFAEVIFAEVQLNAAARISEMREDSLSVRAPRDDAAGNGNVRTFLFTGTLRRHVGKRFRSGAIARIRIRKRLDRRALQRIELFASRL